MKTNFADTDYARKVAMMQQQSLNVFPPAILYTKAKPKLDSKTDIVKDQYQKIKVPIDHLVPDGQSTEWKVPLFENGTPEEFIKWKISFDELVTAMNLTTTAQKHSMLRNLLKGDARDKYDTGTPKERQREMTT